ncbi:Inosose isomerase [Anatilimnocola aggregata]|uniref:Inosose isomerase n=1 Tax=Anatilimnocola aggregata TaxID=2528021 RepID=A0A517YB84_9BACT|nr:sugar phosphate isomerase/epimerase [Anatilimnocola aggregata]QDU27392.1 Inosose isomerase [Anatilimnocola aggregata]
MLATISQVCSLNSPFAKDLEDYAAGHCGSVEIWLTKFETWLEQHSLDEFRRLRNKLELQTPVASFQGGLLASQGERRQEAWQLLDRRLQLCQQAEIGTIVVACDVPRQGFDQQMLERVLVSLQDLGQRCGNHGVRAAIEFQSSAAFGNNVKTLAMLLADLNLPSLGICLDAFHYHTSSSKPADLTSLTSENLFHVQLCDIADLPRELASDSQRILPGEGDIDLVPLLDRLRAIHYTGCVSLEVLNPQLWLIPPLQMGEIGITCLRRLLGQASM